MEKFLQYHSHEILKKLMILEEFWVELRGFQPPPPHGFQIICNLETIQKPDQDPKIRYLIHARFYQGFKRIR